MAAAAGDMAEGRPVRPVSTEVLDEVGELARAFNRMSGELAEVDRERRELIANVSHELRTPISALRAVIENIVDGVEPPEPVTLRTMLAQVDRLGRLVRARATERGAAVAPGQRRSRANPPGGEEPARERDPPLAPVGGE